MERSGRSAAGRGTCMGLLRAARRTWDESGIAQRYWPGVKTNLPVQPIEPVEAAC